MQSGISASQTLLNAFNTFVSSSDQRALFAEITAESIEPGVTIPLQNHDDFTADLHLLTSHLKPDRATYILLKTHPTSPNGYAAITYVPDTAPGRQKMLFASTRLTLVRELGIERFRETIFATEAAELTKAGWAAHEAHERLSAPLTTEEAGLAGVREAEAAESQGTGARRGHVAGTVDLRTADGVLEALASLREQGCRGTLVQLKFALPDETLRLESSTDGVAPERVSELISVAEPRFSFYSSAAVGLAEPEIVFVYTCPTASKIKERMVYSTSKSWVRTIAERDAGIIVKKSLEATDPADLTSDQFGESQILREGVTESGALPPAKTFARPKRPGGRR